MASSQGTRTILFRLLTIPVTIHKAVDDKATPSLSEVHKKDLSPTTRKTFCSKEDLELDGDEVEKAFRLPTGKYLPIEPDELAALPIVSRTVIAIEGFVKPDAIDPIAYESPYYLGVPKHMPPEPYVLLREALTRTGAYAVAKVSLSTSARSESLAVIRPSGAVLVLHTVRWPALLRKPDMAPPPEVTVSSADLDMACELIERDSGLDLLNIRDKYATAFNAMIKAKVKGEEPPHGVPIPELAEPIDLSEALRKSLKRGGRAGSAAAKRRTAAPAKTSRARTGAAAAKPSKTAGARSAAGSRKAAPTKRASGRRGHEAS